MTSNGAQEYNIATIRQLLLEAFTPEDLHRFCRDHPTFRPVTKRFGQGHGRDDMVDELISYCETRLLFDELLAEVRQVNPRQYAHFAPDLYTPEKVRKRSWPTSTTCWKTTNTGSSTIPRWPASLRCARQSRMAPAWICPCPLSCPGLRSWSSVATASAPK